MSPLSAVPPAEVDINPALIQGLIDDQHPDLSGLPIGDRYEGWDNVTTRLGDDLAIRMPRLEASAPLLGREIDWLPQIGPNWGFGAPVPVRMGRPGRGFPWRWSIVPWFEGVDASVEPLAGAGAEDLGLALREIHVPVPADAPTTPWRTTPLSDREVEATGLLEALDARVESEGISWDGVAARRLWRETAALPWQASTWVHADIHVRNLVTREGRLVAILDWGESGAGDPAQDLGQIWPLLEADDAARAFAAEGYVDDETLTRARGEALMTAVRLVSTGERGFIEAGWRGLRNLDLVSGPPPQH
jgi:aminoglycoside phosphotransferase (APT) family kinase protein